MKLDYRDDVGDFRDPSAGGHNSIIAEGLSYGLQFGVVSGATVGGYLGLTAITVESAKFGVIGGLVVADAVASGAFAVRSPRVELGMYDAPELKITR